MRVILDGMGGDSAPIEIISGAVLAVKEKKDLSVTVTGDEKKINEILKSFGEDFSDRIKVVPTSEVVENEDDPISAVRTKKDSSLVKALKLVSEGEGDSFVSAGNTGAVFTGATLIIKRLEGIKRSALAPLIPTLKGNAVLIDSGANAECKSEYYSQFGLMGSVYCECVFGKKNPKVGLINIGVEHHKGTHTIVEAYNLLKENKDINFVGNIEARDVLFGLADVYVSDGWSGNLVVKSIEGTIDALMQVIKGVFKTNLLTKLAAMIILPHFKKALKKFDAKETGGAIILGLKTPAVKAHGNSDRIAIKNAILFADKCAEQQISKKIQELVKTELSDTVNVD